MANADELLRQVLEWVEKKRRTATNPEEARRWQELQRHVIRGEPGARDEALTAMVDEQDATPTT
jgi:hypothetical protein